MDLLQFFFFFGRHGLVTIQTNVTKRVSLAVAYIVVVCEM